MKTPTIKIGLRGHFNEGAIYATTQNGAHWAISIAANGREETFEPLPWILAGSADDMRRTWENWVRENVGPFPMDLTN